jgi:hypothetical protein
VFDRGILVFQGVQSPDQGVQSLDHLNHTQWYIRMGNNPGKHPQNIQWYIRMDNSGWIHNLHIHY